MKSERSVALLGPSLSAVSGVSTHLNMLIGSQLAQRYSLFHFQVGSEGRNEGALQRLLRLIVSPFVFAVFLARQRPDIVHINTSLVPRAYWRDFAYLCVAKLLGRKVVSQIHGGALPESFATNPITRFLLRRFLRTSDVVTVLSTEELHAYRSFDAAARIELVPNAIVLSKRLTQARPEAEAGTLRFVYVGRIARTKGLFDVIDALSLLHKDGLVFDCAIAGSGLEEEELQRQIKSLGLEYVVRLLGSVFGEEKEQLWVNSDLFLFPTFHVEGLPYSILESLAAGCVPITCPVAAIPDVMQDGVHGLFVPAHDPAAMAVAIRRLANDRSEMLRMSQAGRSRIAAEYTVDRLARRFNAIYESLEN